MAKSRDAFRTISEVAAWMDTPAHVLRFWESRFSQIRPVKRAGGRRYYRPSDMALLAGIKKLLHEDGMTIRGVQKILHREGVRHVASLSPWTVTPEACGSVPADRNRAQNGAAAGEPVARQADLVPAAPARATRQGAGAATGAPRFGSGRPGAAAASGEAASAPEKSAGPAPAATRLDATDGTGERESGPSVEPDTETGQAATGASTDRTHPAQRLRAARRAGRVVGDRAAFERLAARVATLRAAWEGAGHDAAPVAVE